MPERTKYSPWRKKEQQPEKADKPAEAKKSSHKAEAPATKSK
jgi:hypothetical protein